MGGKPRSKKIVIGGFRFERRHLCGKSAAHWEQMAKEHVIEVFLRAFFALDESTIAGTLAKNRLVELASAESPELFVKVLQERSRHIEGFARIINEILRGPG